MVHSVNSPNIQTFVSPTETATTSGNRLTAFARTVSSFTTKIFSSISEFLRAHPYATTAGVAMVGAAVALRNPDAVRFVGEKFNTSVNAAGEILRKGIETATPAVARAVGVAREGFNNAVDAATPAVARAASTVSDGFKAVTATLSEAASAVGTRLGIVAPAETYSTVVRTTVSNALSSAGTEISNLASTVGRTALRVAPIATFAFVAAVTTFRGALAAQPPSPFRTMVLNR